MRRRQRGISLVAAIFLIVVIALLASFAVTAGTSKLGTTSQLLMADRAAAAAHAGAEWGANRARAGVCPAPPGIPFNIAQGALRGFRVTVSCTSTAHAAPLNWYVRDITAVAQYGNFGASDYAARTAYARVSNAP